MMRNSGAILPMRTVSILALWSASLGSCSRNPQTEGIGTRAVPRSSSDSVRSTASAIGVIYVAGAEPDPALTLRPDTGSSLVLTGDLANELRRLTGARVRVQGRFLSAPRGIRVRDYTVLEIDGRHPHIGRLATVGDTLWLVDRDSLALADPTGQLLRFVGAKVWVLADTTKPMAIVQSYGLIREASQ
jgi:hypothetical protein